MRYQDRNPARGKLQRANAFARLHEDAAAWMVHALHGSCSSRYVQAHLSSMVIFTKFLIGVWCNAMFFAYLVSPRIVHRLVGYLEEEAVYTYTRQIKDLDAGRLPKWEKMQAPQIAIDYWKMPEGHQTMRDLLLYSKNCLHTFQ
jgi:hypothetical protein